MTKSEIFKKAHQIAKETVALVGNYMIALSLALKEVYAMTTETLEIKLLNMGLKVWEKGSVKRIYVKSSIIKELIDFENECAKDSYLEKNTKAILKRLDSEGAWLNCVTGQIESKKVTVQTWLETSEFSSTFGY